MDTTNRNTALASALADELARCGVERAVICPGSRSTPLALALWRQREIEVRVIVDERSAGFFALGAAQATAKPVAILCTSGTAAANLHPAVCEADESGLPLIVLTADRPPELRGIGAGQTIDQIKLYGSSPRWFCEVGNHDADDVGLLHFRSVACRAFAAAAGDPRPGPVHLNIAFRDPLGPEPRAGDVSAGSALALEGRDRGRPLTTVPAPPPALAEELVGAVAEQLGSTERGLIVAGRMPAPGAAGAISALAAATGFPLLAEPTSQLRFGTHDLDLVVSAYEPVARARPETLAPELVLRFGEMPTCKPLRQWLADLSDTRQLVVAPAGWNEPTRIAAAIVRADPAALADALVGEIESRGRGVWAERWLGAAAAAQAAITDELERLGSPTEPGAHAALGRLYSDGELVYTASSMPIRDQEAFVGAGTAEVRFLANRGANGIDGLISSGIGAADATGCPTWIVTGDLGLFHDMNALATLREVEVPVRLVVLNNDGGGIFEFLPQADQLDRNEFEALLGTPLGLDPGRIADLHGVEHRRIDELAQLAALPAETALIEIAVDRAVNVSVHERVGEIAADALVRALG